MTKYFLLVFLFVTFTCCQILAQNMEMHAVAGTVKDEDGKLLEFSVVSLKNSSDSSLLQSAVTDVRGKFIFKNIKTGKYFLIANMSGYKEAVSASFQLNKDSSTRERTIVLSSLAFIAEDVVIQGQKSTIQQQAGLTVVNIENSTINAGLSVADAMKRVPGVSVDNNGKLKLKGKDGVMVMIDDKPLYLDASQVGALLKSLPADQVKQIEVMTSPSAKFDAAGTAGIINIRLKKGAYEGFDGTINNSLGSGIYPKASSGINVSFRKNKFVLTGAYQYNYRKNLQRFYIFRKYITPVSSDSAYNTSSDFSQPDHTHNLLFGGSYSIGKSGSLSWDANSIFNRSFWNGGSNSQILSSEGKEFSTFRTTDHSHDQSSMYSTSIGYKHKLDTIGTELSALIDYKSLQKKSFQNFTTVYHNSTTPPLFYSSDIPITLNQGSAKIDFTKLFFKKIKTETGLKYNSVLTESTINNTLGQANHFIYSEHIYAAYAQLGMGAGKWKAQAGLRLEHTGTMGNQKSTDSIFTRRYTNLFPSASLSYQKSDKTSYSFLYTKRIDRPNYESLNPFAYYNDPYSIYSGYPYLLPQYTQHLELTSSHWSGVFLTTLDYSYTSRPQTDVFIIDQQKMTTTYTKRNLTSLQNAGISFSLNIPLTKWWSMTNFLHFYNNKQKGNVGFGERTLSKFSWSFNATHTFKLPKKFSAEISGVYEAPFFYGTVFYKNLWQISLGLSKKLLKDRFTVKVSATDIAWKYFYQGEGSFGSIKTNDGYKWDNRVIMFTLSYHLRKSLFSQEKEKGILENGAGGKGR